jgi:very-short-patch-repair endonuclease
MKQSAGEAEFALHCRANKLSPIPEYQFAPPRRWRADFAFPDAMLLVEIEGGVWTNGRHNRGSGFTADCEKYNAAAMLGYFVLRFTPDMVKKGEAIAQVIEFIKQKKIKKR